MRGTFHQPSSPKTCLKFLLIYSIFSLAFHSFFECNFNSSSVSFPVSGIVCHSLVGRSHLHILTILWPISIDDGLSRHFLGHDTMPRISGQEHRLSPLHLCVLLLCVASALRTPIINQQNCPKLTLQKLHIYYIDFFSVFACFWLGSLDPFRPEHLGFRNMVSSDSMFRFGFYISLPGMYVFLFVLSGIFCTADP